MSQYVLFKYAVSQFIISVKILKNYKNEELLDSVRKWKILELFDRLLFRIIYQL